MYIVFVLVDLSYVEGEFTWRNDDLWVSYIGGRAVCLCERGRGRRTRSLAAKRPFRRISRRVYWV